MLVVFIIPGYEPYDDGLAKNVFIKRYQSNDPIVNKVWPGFTVFPEYVLVLCTKLIF